MFLQLIELNGDQSIQLRLEYFKYDENRNIENSIDFYYALLEVLLEKVYMCA